MAANASEQTPRIATASFPGPRHIKAGVVRQDAAAGRAEQRRAVIAVADGHGDPNCRYSDWGAVVASRVAVEVLWQFIGGDEEKVQCRTPGLAPTSEEITQAVRRIAYLWRVRTAQLSQLFDQWEISQRIDGLAIGGGSAGAEAAAKSALFDEQALDQIVAAGPDDNRSHLFGTTLLAAAIWKKHLLLLKIGDGEIILSHAAGEPERWGERSQEKNYSNRTDSLSGGPAPRKCADPIHKAASPPRYRARRSNPGAP